VNRGLFVATGTCTNDINQGGLLAIDHRLENVVQRLGGDAPARIASFPETPTPWADTYSVSWAEDDRRCVVRLIRQDLAVDDVVSTEFAIATLLGERGLGPKVISADVDARTLVMEEIAGTPAVPATPEQAAQIATVLRELHTVDELGEARLQVARRESANTIVCRLVDEFPELSIYGEAVERFDTIRAALRSLKTAERLCHNDLNPGNVLFDDSRAWLIDFDHAGHGDPLFDVATVLMSLDMAEDAREAFLHEYFGGLPDAQELARLEILSSLVLLRYGISALSLVPEHLRPRLSTWRDSDVGRAFVFARPDGEELGWSVFRLSLGFVSAGMARAASLEFERAARVLGLDQLAGVVSE
jgi:Ser/Thr protein kinase RdoA (MazF antagonist)